MCAPTLQIFFFHTYASVKIAAFQRASLSIFCLANVPLHSLLVELSVLNVTAERSHDTLTLGKKKVSWKSSCGRK